MSRWIVVLVAIAVIVAYGYALSDEPINTVEGQFSVAAVGDSAILLDTQTGDSWLMHHPLSDRMPAVWIPMQRLSSEEDVAAWHAGQQELADVMAERSRLTTELQLARDTYEEYQRSVSNEELIQEARERVAELEAQLNSNP